MSFMLVVKAIPIIDSFTSKRAKCAENEVAGGGASKATFNVATPMYATVTCAAYVLPYNLQTKSI